MKKEQLTEKATPAIRDKNARQKLVKSKRNLLLLKMCFIVLKPTTNVWESCSEVVISI